MDAGLLGGLIGVGVMVFFVCGMVLYEKRMLICHKVQETPLPVPPSQPILVRSPSQQFQMKQILILK